MLDANEEAQRLWARSELKRVPGKITRVSATFVSVALPVGIQSIPWPGPTLKVGDRVTVAGDMHRGAFRALVVELGGLFRKTRIAIPRPPIGKAPATAPQPWLGALVRHRLIESAEAVPESAWDGDAVGVLVCVHEPRGAIARGFVHYDHRWGNDTDDLIADLAAIAERPLSFRGVREDSDAIELDVLRDDGSSVRERIDVEGDIDQVAVRMNHWLERLGAERRIWCLDTGGDRFAFLGRPLAELEALRAEVPLPLTIEEARQASDRDGSDWSDVLD